MWDLPIIHGLKVNMFTFSWKGFDVHVYVIGITLVAYFLYERLLGLAVNGKNCFHCAYSTSDKQHYDLFIVQSEP